MLTLTGQDITAYREPTQETDTDWEQEVIFTRDGRAYCVTVYARADYGPSIFTYSIADDATGDSLFDARVSGCTSGPDLRVNLAVIGQLSRRLFDSVKE